MRSSSPAAPRRSAPWRTGCRTRASTPVDRIVGPGQRLGDGRQDRGLRRGRHRPAGRPVRGPGPRRAAGRCPSRGRGPLTQAEHGPDSPAILVTTDAAFADAVEARGRRPAGDGARAATSSSGRSREHGRIVLAPDLDAAIAFVNDYAPEHLSVDVEPLEPTVARLRNAGSLFVGPWAPESAGDYATGANHVLPTGGLARSLGRPGGRGLRQVRARSSASPATAWPRSRETVATLAEAEGLPRPPRRRRRRRFETPEEHDR